MTFAVRDEDATFRLGDQPGRAAMQIEHLVRGIGADSLFVILFKWPENVSKFEFAEPDQNFLQVTGGEEGLTVEVMSDGKLSAVGHPDGEAQSVQLQRQDGSTIEVRRNEVLRPDEAVELFTSFLETESVDAAKWSLRGIPLAGEPEPKRHAESGASASGDAPDAPPVVGGVRQGELRIDTPGSGRDADSDQRGSAN